MSEKKSKKTSAEATPKAVSGSPMDVGLLQQIVRLMAANDLNTVDVRDGTRRIILRRGAAAVAPVAYAPPTAPAPAANVPVAAPAAAKPAPDDEAGLLQIKSPMVGTFYAASSPDAKPFVTVGSIVNDDTDVCIIEAMKVFNNIKADCSGKIVKICVQNGRPVEFGTVLFLVKPS